MRRCISALSSVVDSSTAMARARFRGRRRGCSCWGGGRGGRQAERSCGWEGGPRTDLPLAGLDVLGLAQPTEGVFGGGALHVRRLQRGGVSADGDLVVAHVHGGDTNVILEVHASTIEFVARRGLHAEVEVARRRRQLSAETARPWGQHAPGRRRGAGFGPHARVIALGPGPGPGTGVGFWEEGVAGTRAGGSAGRARQLDAARGHVCGGQGAVVRRRRGVGRVRVGDGPEEEAERRMPLPDGVAGSWDPVASSMNSSTSKVKTPMSLGTGRGKGA